jgi:hypothetical protein
MHLRTSISVAAFSKDGTSVLLKITEDGPEGGSSTVWTVTDGSGASKAFGLTNDLSDGASAHEHIGAADCKATAGALAKRLAAYGFDGVTIKPEACDKDRGAVVTLSSPDRGEKAKVSVKARRVLVETRGARGDVGEKREDVELDAIASKSGKLVVVLAGPHDDRWIFAVARAKDGKLEPVQIDIQ